MFAFYGNKEDLLCQLNSVSWFSDIPHEVISRDSNWETIVLNVPGISANNISINLEENRIWISGKQKNEITGKTHSVQSSAWIDCEKVQKIKWRVKDGILYIDVFFKEPESPKIEIIRED